MGRKPRDEIVGIARMQRGNRIHVRHQSRDIGFADEDGHVVGAFENLDRRSSEAIGKRRRTIDRTTWIGQNIKKKPVVLA